jgi:hypothetical protein
MFDRNGGRAVKSGANRRGWIGDLLGEVEMKMKGELVDFHVVVRRCEGGRSRCNEYKRRGRDRERRSVSDYADAVDIPSYAVSVPELLFGSRLSNRFRSSPAFRTTRLSSRWSGRFKTGPWLDRMLWNL